MRIKGQIWSILTLFYLLTDVHGFENPFADHHEAERKLSIRINPGCWKSFGSDSGCESWKNMSLIHIKSISVNESDTIHFIYSFIGPPSFILARTPWKTRLRVDWPKLLLGQDRAIKFDGHERYYSFGWSFLKVWLFSDKNDVGRLDKANQSQVYGYDTNEFFWERDEEESNDLVNCTTDIRLNFVSKIYNNVSLGNDAYFKISIQVNNKDSYGAVLPRLMTNANSSHFDISVHKVQMNYPEENPANTRFAFNFVFVQENDNFTSESEMRIKTSKSLDDEHTPGVFELIKLVTPVLKEFEQSYVEWKPICYVGEIRDITDSSEAVHYPLAANQTTLDNPLLSKSILYSLYGTQLNNLLVEGLNISFGSPQDGYFNKTGHFSWTFVSGFGIPPEDKVSLLVVLILAIGFGAPLLSILIAGLCVAKRKLSVPKDELLLGGGQY